MYTSVDPASCPAPVEGNNNTNPEPEGNPRASNQDTNPAQQADVPDSTTSFNNKQTGVSR